jgi:uracil-DNA glycosylase
MYKEIEAEFGCVISRTPDLTRWAKQGVLLLNTSLTVASGMANSHVAYGWNTFTDAVIAALARKEEHIVFMLWGNNARQKRTLIDQVKHLILESAHPSPLSAHKGFLGNGHFKKANAYLEKQGRGSIVWC